MIHLNTLFPLRYVMNLGQAAERRFEAQYELAVNSLEARRWPAFDSSYLRNYWGYPSVRHAAHCLTLRVLLRHAYHRKQNVLLLEDDIAISGRFADVLEQAVLPEDWNMVYLGCLHVATPRWTGDHVVKVSQALDTHAVGFRWEAIPGLLKHLSPRNPKYANSPAASDVRILDFQREASCYAIFPNIVSQKQLLSAIDQNVNTKYHQDGSQAWCAEVLENLSPSYESSREPALATA